VAVNGSQTMTQFTALATFTLPHELAVVQSLLESYQIECLVKDELTVQVHNFYSNAIGGITLSVKPKDLAQAESILREHNFETHLSLQSENTLASEIEFSESARFKYLKLAIQIIVGAAILVVIGVILLVLFVK
jgi:preprotein translocase subunit Sec61beta|tara:strand:+ start:144304 stop:144705 length:402 start_codon:yes stop_codon:yes gene_type:complete